MAELNVLKLTKELLESGLQIHGVSSDGEISWVKKPTEAQELTASNIISAHDPAPDQKSLLRDEYSKVGVNTKEMVFAMWKKIMQNDPTDADALQSLIDQVNSALA